MAPRKGRAPAVTLNEAQRDALFEIIESTGMMQERIAELELAIEDAEWVKLGDVDREFSRSALRSISRLARLAFLKNPLIRRAVNVMRLYVFAQGVTIGSRDENVNAIVQAFLDDPQNRKALFSIKAMGDRERDARLDSNLFFALFTDPITGRVQCRFVVFDEIEDIEADPDDRLKVRFYKRSWTRATVRDDGSIERTPRVDWYPDVEYWLSATDRPKTHAGPADVGNEIRWDTPMYHLKVGEVGDMKFGVPEVYPALDWAKATKADLEDYATVKRALARFAMMLTTKGGKAGVARAKTILGTTVAKETGNTQETVPPPVTGSTFIAAEGAAKLEPFRTAGAQPSSEDGRAMRLMVSAATGVPETILMGNADVGNLATAKTLDRPTELAVVERQRLWGEVYSALCRHSIIAALKATRPRVKPEGLKLERVPDTDIWEIVADKEERDITVDATWPSVLQRDVQTYVDAVISAATLDGKSLAGTMPEPVLVRLLLEAVGVQDIDEVLKLIFPPDYDPEVDSVLAPEPVPTAFGVPGGNGAQPLPPGRSGNGGPPMPPSGQVRAAMRDLITVATRVLEREDRK